MENKTSKYLKYALGEIILVVIGILIALSINNWNDRRNNDIKEYKLLNEMHDNLKNDSIDMAGNIVRNTRVLHSAEAIQYQLENNIAWNDSMATHYSHLNTYTSKIAIVKSSYENLKSIGFDLIKNDSLRGKIHELYAQQYPFVERMESEHMEAMKYSLLLPQLTSKVKSVSKWKAKPLDLNTLVFDNQFKETVILFIKAQEGFIGLYKYLQQLQSELIEMIEKEIAIKTLPN
ncbi:DUF6090 family protein [Winogradskyella sp. 4-2091]|uniref:DUF6090 family protein n=1 Tax=Winogradskyella sp. 4-2091 TaxID=3381659 RepID=UPI003891E0C8